MAKKLETIKLIAVLEKAAKATKKEIWSDLALRLQGPSRGMPIVNLDKLNNEARKNEGKILIVPGKILSKGEITKKLIIAAVSISEGAKKKINAKGEFMTLEELAKKAEKIKVSDLIIIK
ncbi:MAG: 50S ribosomal protein L18e [Candidatus Diapherotrites archaeon]|nr:50S ribosomal protein L18e [Candidatus Diapherotrites archaeon]